MAVRIALQCSESDAHLILSESNSAAKLLSRPGEAIYNDANGSVEGNHFFQVYGGNSFDHKKPHPVGIETLRAEVNAAGEDTWMVGDSWVDVQTARNAGVAACGVTWGFQPETFREFPPDVLVDRMEDFAERFIAS